jgi:hypothetical protein
MMEQDPHQVSKLKKHQVASLECPTLYQSIAFGQCQSTLAV